MKTNLSSDGESASETAGLEHLIARFACDYATLAEERAALPQTPRAQLKVLLREISETLMPRDIEITRDGAFTVHLTVANRRLLSISGGANRAALTTTKQLAAGLIELSKHGKTLTSRVATTQATSGDNCQGATVEMLRAALGFNTPVCAVTHLKTLLSPFAEAQMTWTADLNETAFEGADVWRDILQAHAQRIRDTALKQRVQTPVKPQGTTGMALPLSKDKVLVIAYSDKSGVASVTPSGEGLKAISAWQIACETSH